MRAYFSRRYHFSASHRLHNDAYSEAENRTAYGKCNNPYGHGHNYVVEVMVGGPVDEQTGMVCDMVQLDGAVRTKIVSRFDHTNLNLDPLFRDAVPTTENLCIAIHQELSSVFDVGELGAVDLVRVRVEETNNNSFEYSAPALLANASRKELHGTASLNS
jgi:6-pyruvoyltetrahydropterin/6-carboxytetrahydropterin synthase